MTDQEYIRISLTLAPFGVEWRASRPGRFTSR